MKIKTALATVFLIASCGAACAGGSPVAKVKADILNSLKDPDSAKFRNVTVSRDGSVVCGEVNAKNAMGGYVGFKKFTNQEDAGKPFMFYEDSDNPKIIAMMAEACSETAKR